jgi:hypothetical protein
VSQYSKEHKNQDLKKIRDMCWKSEYDDHILAQYPENPIRAEAQNPSAIPRIDP